MNFNRSVMRWLVMAAAVLSLSAASFAQVFVSVRIGPPPLPVYAQPICPGPGYIWAPGYWAWNDDDGYYWVPGTWAFAPVGMLWTPGWWGWGAGFYAWHPGYWGPHVGFYGGINYGYGYTGVGFVGGEWRGNNFYYNRSVTNVSVTNVTNVYNKTVIVNNTTVNNVSYNGGTGGVKAEPTPQEARYDHEQHTPALSTQVQHEQMASQNRQNFASENHGRPAIAATAKAADFSSRSTISARAAGGEYHPPAMSPREARGPSAPGNRPFTPANSNNANRTVGGGAPTPQERSNQGFRPFTPPNSNNAPKGQMGANARAPQNRSDQGFRPFTPPNSSNPQNKGGSVNPAYKENRNSGQNPQFEQNDRTVRGASAPPNQPRPEFRPAPQPNRASPPPRAESRPAPQQNRASPPPRAESRPAPQQNRPSPPPPKKQNPSNEERHK